MLQPSVVSERLKEFFFPNSSSPVFFSCSREGLLQMAVEWFIDRHIFMIVNGPMSQEWYDIADDCRATVTLYDTAYGAEPDINALGLELQKEKFDLLMFVETDVYTGTSLNAAAICAEFRSKCPDGLIVTDISGCIFCGFDETIAGLSDICLCASEIAMGLPPGLGMTILNERSHTRVLAHNIENGRYFNYARQTVSRSVSALDAPVYPLLNALNEQIDTVLTETIPERIRRMTAVRNFIYEWANLHAFPLLASQEVSAINATAIRLPAGMSPQEMVDFAARYGVFLTTAVGQMSKELLIIYHGNDITMEDAAVLTRVLDRFLTDYDTRRRSTLFGQQPQEQKV
jgi:aspartate aminotransferase-like enzyme